MTEKNSIVAEQFVDAAQQNEATALGLWTFIATEILFFGGLFLSLIFVLLRAPAPSRRPATPLAGLK